ncbi:MAG TPA: LysR family transcriptional regulator [Alphaproteobacteria bacterium]
MELTWIDDFIALERTRHFTKAADLRGTTQSAYSRRIMRLEDWLGCRLFERDTRPINLTPEGEEFFARAKRLRAEIIDTKRAVNALASRYDRAKRIYTTNSLAIGFFSEWAEKQNLNHYSVTVSSLTTCIEAVRTGRADHALIPLFEGVNTGELRVEKIGTDQLQLMATKKIAPQVMVKNKKLHGPILLYPPATAYGSLADRMLKTEKIVLDQEAVCESASAEALAALVNNNMGAAWLPAILNNGKLVPCNVPKALRWDYDIALISV